MEGHKNYEPKVAIILLNWNGINDTVPCIKSLLAMTYTNYKIFVSDNNSTNDEAVKIKDMFPSVRVIASKENFGFAEGNNVAIRTAQREYNPNYFWILNNDTEVEPKSLQELVQYADTNSIVGSTIYYWQSQKIYCLAGGKINSWTGIDTLYGARKIIKEIQPPKKLDYISGCSMLIPQNIFEHIGLFDNKYFLYNEESDLCVRATQVGFKQVYAPSSIVYHKFAQSSGHLSYTYVYYFLRNKLLFMKKHTPWYKKFSYIFSYSVYYVGGSFLLSLLRGNYKAIGAIQKGIADALHNKYGKML